MIDLRTPILVGSGQVSDFETPPESGQSAIDMIERAARKAAIDTGAGEAILKALDSICILRLYTDTSWRFQSRFGRCTNPPAAVAGRIGASKARLQYTHPGGNMPQYMVNRTAEEIAAGEVDLALIGGGEALRTMRGARKAGTEIDWSEDAPDGYGDYTEIGDPRVGISDYEERHEMRAPIYMYPMVENGIRAHRGRDVGAHQKAIGRLLEGFARVAAANPLAARREGYSAEEIATVSLDNRYIGFPYTKLMNSNPYIDQSAAVIMTSVEKATALGIDPSRWVFLHGCGDATDHWFVSERVNYHSSPAIRMMSSKAFDMVGKTVDEMDHLDLYSCFPSAIQMGCQEIGVAEDDPRGLTVTGGLPFFGGPGNNYVTHSIAEMVNKVRAQPGSFGLCTANGHNVTKHAAGIYSTTPTEGPWQREDPAGYQSKLDAMAKPVLVEEANGAAKIETYTVMHRPDGPEHGLIIGRLTETGARFLANTPADAATLYDLQENGEVGRAGFVTCAEGKNSFTPE
jgi:acetyl-CoA C-acetyltransferase